MNSDPSTYNQYYQNYRAFAEILHLTKFMLLGEYCPDNPAEADLFLTWDYQNADLYLQSEFYPLSFTAPTYTSCWTATDITLTLDLSIYGGDVWYDHD